MNAHEALHALAWEAGVYTRFHDGLGRVVSPSTETLVRVLAALGLPIESEADAPAALEHFKRERDAELLPPVAVAWDGHLHVQARGGPALTPRLELEGGGEVEVARDGAWIRSVEPLPWGYHRLFLTTPVLCAECTVISAPQKAWRDSDAAPRRWGIGTQLPALRRSRSRSVGDLSDLAYTCEALAEYGCDLVTVLPLLPTFNDLPAEPSPYSPVSRLFWSEIVLDLGEDTRPVGAVETLDVTAADAEVRAGLAHAGDPGVRAIDAELRRYADFRGAQKRLGRNWRDWPEPARSGHPTEDQIDAEEARYHRVAQTAVGEQLEQLKARVEAAGVYLGLDLAVGAHPDGYDSWSRQEIFANGISVGAPPDGGFPSGQDWGFAPVIPTASRREGHRYLAASIAHQAGLTGVLRIDHIMAFTRLYWIPHGMSLHEGTYVHYPADELFAILTLESHRNQCEVVGENLGTVPPEIGQALPRHDIRGMHLAMFVAGDETPPAPSRTEVGFVGTHDTPTFAGWVEGVDIAERVRCGLLPEQDEEAEREARATAVQNLAGAVDADPEDVGGYLDAVLDWIAASPSPLILPWIEDLWLEIDQVNLPGTPSSQRPNWQRPLSAPLEELMALDEVDRRLRRVAAARGAAVASPSSSPSETPSS